MGDEVLVWISVWGEVQIVCTQYHAVVKVRGARGTQPPASTLPPPLLESEPSLPMGQSC